VYASKIQSNLFYIIVGKFFIVAEPRVARTIAKMLGSSMLAKFSRKRITKVGHKVRSSLVVYVQQRDLNVGFWDKVELGPPDPILGITEKYNNDPNGRKVNLGVGAYRDDKGKPYVLPSVREAERRIFEGNQNHEYAGILGVPDFVKASQKLLFGKDSPALKEGRVCSAQALSGTGALRIGADFCRRFLKNNQDFYLPDPTWANHLPLFADAGFKTKKYSYYDVKKIALDFAGVHDTLRILPDRSNILFHVCAHNPTGIDPSNSQWDTLSKVCKEKDHFIFFDSAYQGFASGDPTRDAYAVRKFIDDGHKPIVCQSFAKNFGLYGERVGALHIVAETPQKKKRSTAN